MLLLVFVALSIVIITLDFRQNPGGPLKRARDLAAAVVAPVQRGLATVTRPVGDFFSSIGDLANLRSENERLRDELATAASAEEQLDDADEEIARLRELLGLQRSWRQMETVAAQVIAAPPSNSKWTVTIDEGRAAGIRPDMAVVSAEGLVGKVVGASSNTATVLLLIDPAGAAGARVEDEGSTGIVRGEGGGEFLTLQFIRTDAEVDTGDSVVTSGLDRGIFPAGIEIGSVAEVGGEEADVSADIAVDPSVDFDSLQEVMVLVDTGDLLGPKGRRQR